MYVRPHTLLWHTMQDDTTSGCTWSVCQIVTIFRSCANCSADQDPTLTHPTHSNPQTGHIQRLVLGAHCNLRSTKSSLSISEHLRCDVSLTSLTSRRGKPLQQGPSRSVHAAHYYAAVHSTPVSHRSRHVALQMATHTHTHTRLKRDEQADRQGTALVANESRQAVRK